MASIAYEELDGSLGELSTADIREFRSASRSFPTTIASNGLVAAIAMMCTKKGRGWKRYRQALEKGPGVKETVEAVLVGSATWAGPETLRRSAELESMAGWLKRAAEAKISADDNAAPPSDAADA